MWRCGSAATPPDSDSSLPGSLYARAPPQRGFSDTAARNADEVLDELDQMIGLAPVKEEVNKLLAGIEVERKRREQGLPVGTGAGTWFSRPARGAEKPRWPRARRNLLLANVLRKGHVVRCSAPIWSPAISADCSKTLESASRRSTASCSSTKPIRSRAPGSDSAARLSIR